MTGGVHGADRRPLVLLALALAGGAISAYLAAYQVGLIGAVWDPLFGDGSERVLTSSLSQRFPVPDALLGAIAYAVEAVLILLLLARIGRPELVSGLLAVVAVCGALAGIALAFSQPLLVGSFCTLCLCSSAISVVLAAGALSEARRHWLATDGRSRPMEVNR